jgi:hypothetical protein
MKKTFIPVFLIAALLFTSLPVLAWQYGGPGPGGRGGYRPAPRYYAHSYYRGPGIGGIIGGLLVGGLIAGAVVAATTPPVVVQQPVYVQQPAVMAQPAPRMCSEERQVTGEYQYDPNGNVVWVPFARPAMRSYQVPCQ